MATISAELTSGYRVEMTNGSHTWRADEPIDVGGTDTGPNPYELLLGGGWQYNDWEAAKTAAAKSKNPIFALFR